MGIIFIISNLLIAAVIGLGIFSFSESVIFAIIGTFVLTSAASQNPIFALVGYPLVEFIFNGALTEFSAIVIGITVIQMIIVFFMARSSYR